VSPAFTLIHKPTGASTRYCCYFSIVFVVSAEHYRWFHLFARRFQRRFDGYLRNESADYESIPTARKRVRCAQRAVLWREDSSSFRRYRRSRLWSTRVIAWRGGRFRVFAKWRGGENALPDDDFTGIFPRSPDPCSCCCQK